MRSPVQLGNGGDDSSPKGGDGGATNQQLPPRPAAAAVRPQLAAGSRGAPLAPPPAHFPPRPTAGGLAHHHHHHSHHHHFSIMQPNTNNTTMPPRESAAAAAAMTGGGVGGVGAMLTFPSRAHPFPHSSRVDGTAVRAPFCDGAPQMHADDVIFNVAMPLPSQNVAGQDDVFHVRIWGPRYLFAPPQQPSSSAPSSAAASATAPTEHRLVCFLHGAGMSSMSFHLLACQMLGMSPATRAVEVTMEKPSAPQPSREASGDEPSSTAAPAAAAPAANRAAPQSQPRLILVSYDLRGHGRTQMASGAALDYSLDAFASDTSRILSRLFAHGDSLQQQPQQQQQQQQQGGAVSFRWAPDRAVCVVAHSLGGSIASMLSDDRRLPWRQRIFGIVLLDIVEGTAIESLQHMPEFLRRRPTSFASEYDAVMWFVRTGGMRSSEAARVSVPSLLRRVEAQAPQNDDDDGNDADDGDAVDADDSDAASGGSSQEDSSDSNGNGNDGVKRRRRAPAPRFTWIADLHATQPAWATWFRGMDARFLRAVCPRMLCLSSPDKLDKDLTVAHMQGQFQFEVARDCGHYIHEDAPDLVSSILLRFIHRIESQTDKLRTVYERKYSESVSADAALLAATFRH